MVYFYEYVNYIRNVLVYAATACLSGRKHVACVDRLTHTCVSKPDIIGPDTNARNIIFYCEFSSAVLGHAIRMFPGMNDETQSYIFTSGSRRFAYTAFPGDQHGNWCVVFSLSRTPVRFYPWYAKFWTFLLRYVLSTKFLIWSTNAIEVVLVFSEIRFWAENLFTGVTGDTGVNMSFHHARNRKAVQNNALISTIIFSLKQVYWFCQLSAM